MASETRHRILIADDHVLVRDGLKRLINDQEDMEVVAEAGEGAEAVRLAVSVRPSIALVDVSMPGWDGVKVAQTLSQACPYVRIIAVTRHNETSFVRRMMAAGARGYVLKQSSFGELARAIRDVAGGSEYIDPGIAAWAIPPTHIGPKSADTSEALTDVEEQVLRLLADAHTVREIGERLSIPSDQVAELKAAVMRKTGLLTRLHIMDYAHARGWM
jgi:two-component system response regulator NreC